MIQGKWFPTGSDLSQPLAVRQAVFDRGRDALDDWAQQVAVYAGDEPVGAARLWWRDGAFWLGDVGVVPGCRGKGYGDLLVRLLLFKALSHGARFIRLEAPSEAVAFFARYGFREERCGTDKPSWAWPPPMCVWTVAAAVAPDAAWARRTRRPGPRAKACPALLHQPALAGFF